MKRSSMFLLELLAMVLVFSLCATVCVQILGKSWGISQESEQLTEAVYLAEDAAARLQAGAAPEDVQKDESTILVCSSSTAEESAACKELDNYGLRIEELSREGGLVVQRITVTLTGETIYELDVTTEEVAS